jgi:hypothetical protein
MHAGLGFRPLALDVAPKATFSPLERRDPVHVVVDVRRAGSWRALELELVRSESKGGGPAEGERQGRGERESTAIIV